MALVDKSIHEEYDLAKRIIASIIFDTAIVATMMGAHWVLKELSIRFGVDNEPSFSWINGISQTYFIVIFLILLTINMIRLSKSDAPFILSLNPFKQDKSHEEKIDLINPQENTKNKSEVTTDCYINKH